jgi:microcystin-dependent protein
MSDQYLGEIRIFGFHFAPSGWALCNGQTMAISQNAALFAVLGTTFGGNGTTTFGLPNFQDIASMHWGSGAGLTPRAIGEALGTPTVTLASNQIPPHNHMAQSANLTAQGQGIGTPGSTVWPGQSAPGATYSDTTSPLTAQFSPKAVGLNGGNQPHANVQPLLSMNFCIALQGIFPTRN